MLYLHDVWINWFEGEENGYNVCQFAEWRKSDGIELLDQTPLLYVSNELYDYIENDLSGLPVSLLESIHGKTYLRKNQERKSLEYAAVVTNGTSTLVFDTLGYSMPVRKSRLIPRQERLALEMVEGQSPKTFDWTPDDIKKEYHILSLSPEYMMGLTRRERHLKQILMMALDNLKLSNNEDELKYWLTEWNPSLYSSIKNLSADQSWQQLYEGTREGWSKSHEELCKNIIKGHSFFEKLYTEEVEHKTA